MLLCETCTVLLALLALSADLSLEVSGHPSAQGIMFPDQFEKQEEVEKEKLTDVRSVIDPPSMPPGFTEYCSQDFHAIPWFDKQQEEWFCEEIGWQGPCEDGHWFVLDQSLTTSGHLRGICKPWPCEDGRTYAMADTGKCVPEGEQDICSQGMEVLMDPFGEGRCECRVGNIPYDDPANGGERICYPEYLQGPCADGEQIRMVENVYVEQSPLAGQDQGPCAKGEQLLDVTHNPGLSKKYPSGSACLRHFCKSRGKIRWSNGKCLDEPHGPSCKETVSYDEELKALTCVALRQILSFETFCPDGQRKNSNGECKPVVIFGRSSSRRSSSSSSRLATGNSSLKDFIQKRFG